MKIGLVSSLNKDFDIDYNINQIKEYLKDANKNNIDLLCFGEAFIQGFEGLTWDYKKDKDIALKIDGDKMLLLRKLASENKVALSFGFIENDNEDLYSTNIVIDKNGEIIDKFKRLSVGWKEPIASKEYKEGKGLHTFTYMDKTFTTAICGDLFNDTILSELEKIKADIALWPVYLDFSVESWEKQYLAEYIDRVKNVKCPVCMINSYVEDEKRANGGCYVYYNNQILEQLPLGKIGILVYNA